MAAAMVNRLDEDGADAFPERGSSTTQYEFLLRYTAYAATRVVGFSWFPIVAPTGITFSTVHTEDDSCRRYATLIAIGAALATLRVTMRRFGRTAEVVLFPDSSRPDLVAQVALGAPQPPSLDDRLCFNALTAPTSRRAIDEHRSLPQGFLHAAPHLVARHGVWVSAVAAASDRMRLRDRMRGVMQADATDRHRVIVPFMRDELVGPFDLPAPGLFLLGTQDEAPATTVVLGEALQDLVTLLRLHELRARIVQLDDLFAEHVSDALALPSVPQFMVMAAFEAPPH